MKVKNLTDLFLSELRDMYSAEHQLVDALPKMEKAARDEDLQKAFKNHWQETTHHASRIEEILDILGLEKKKATCKAMQGLIAESESIMKDAIDDRAINAALIASAQKIEHYEIASYGTLIALARQLGYDNAVILLQQTLAEEKDADEKLTELAMGGINESAMKHAA